MTEMDEMTENVEMTENNVRSAQRVVETLSAYGVRYVFGVPGAKIDAVFDSTAAHRLRLDVTDPGRRLPRDSPAVTV